MSGTRIISVTAREVYSDRMHAAVQATVSTENGAVGKALIGDGIAQVEERIRTVLQTAEQELLTDSTKE